MVMTHYMELLTLHSPWFLIIFMVIPVVFIELIFIASFFTLLADKESQAKWKNISHYSGIFLGFFFTAASLYLMTNYIPTIQWRGPIDQMAVWSYALGIIPAILLLFMEFGFIFNGPDEKKNTKSHLIIMLLFVLFTHLAMIFGMADPRLAGYEPSQHPMMMDMPMNDAPHTENEMPHNESHMNGQDSSMNNNLNNHMNESMNDVMNGHMNSAINRNGKTQQ